MKEDVLNWNTGFPDNNAKAIMVPFEIYCVFVFVLARVFYDSLNNWYMIYWYMTQILHSVLFKVVVNQWPWGFLFTRIAIDLIYVFNYFK